MKRLFFVLIFILIFGGCSQIASKQTNSIVIKGANKLSENMSSEIIENAKEISPETTQVIEKSCTAFQKLSLILIIVIGLLHFVIPPIAIIGDILVVIISFIVGWSTIISFICIPF